MRRVAALPFVVALLLMSGCQSSALSLGTVATKPQPQIQVQVPTQPPAPSPAMPPAQVAVESLAPPPSPVPAPSPSPASLPSPSAPLPGLAKAPKAEVRAALLVPLSGPNAALGNALSNAAQLALFDLADPHFNLIPLDTHGTPDGAAAAARLALAQGADIILGPLLSLEVKAAAPVAREQAIPMLAFTTDRSALGNGVYTLGFLPGPQVRRVVSQAEADNRTRFAVLAPDTEYGHAVAEAASAAVLGSGAQLVRLDYYDPAARDLTPIAKRFAGYERRRAELALEKKTTEGRGAGPAATAAAAEPNRMPFDAVLLPDEGTRLKSVASLITYFGLDPGPVRLLGTMLWDDSRLSDEPSLQGGWYPAPPAAAHAEFEARYVKAFGPLPARVGIFASTAYDATALAAQLARQGQGDYPPQVLTDPNGFAGVDGIFRLLPDGTSERGLAVYEVSQGGNKEVSPAPTSFAAPPAPPVPAPSAGLSPAVPPSGR
jgi:ABC-type branched-subunit amino acid transport system substrate-binding protein